MNHIFLVSLVHALFWCVWQEGKESLAAAMQHLTQAAAIEAPIMQAVAHLHRELKGTTLIHECGGRMGLVLKKTDQRDDGSRNLKWAGSPKYNNV